MLRAGQASAAAGLCAASERMQLRSAPEWRCPPRFLRHHHLPIHDAALTQGQLPALALPLLADASTRRQSLTQHVFPHSPHSATPAVPPNAMPRALSLSTQSRSCLNSLPPQSEGPSRQVAARYHGDRWPQPRLTALAGNKLRLVRGRILVYSLSLPSAVPTAAPSRLAWEAKGAEWTATEELLSALRQLREEQQAGRDAGGDHARHRPVINLVLIQGDGATKAVSGIEDALALMDCEQVKPWLLRHYGV